MSMFLVPSSRTKDWHVVDQTPHYIDALAIAHTATTWFILKHFKNANMSFAGYQRVRHHLQAAILSFRTKFPIPLRTSCYKAGRSCMDASSGKTEVNKESLSTIGIIYMCAQNRCMQ